LFLSDAARFGAGGFPLCFDAAKVQKVFGMASV
jgi:hypothetical protein